MPKVAVDAVEAAPPAPLAEGCESAIGDLVNALPQVKRELAKARRETERSHGRARFGGMGPNDTGDGGFTASIGVHTDDGFDARVSYDVDHMGTLRVWAGEEVQLAPAVLSEARRVCGR